MKRRIFGLFSFFIIIGLFSFKENWTKTEILSYTVDLKSVELRLFLKNEKGEYFKSIGGLKKWLDSLNFELIFGMNGGMFNNGGSPKGLYIEQHQVLSKLDTLTDGYGNFYLQPNGVFFITDNKKAFICETKNFILKSNIEYATQSGPMLLLNKSINPVFTKGSKNLNIRNGVGIFPDGKVVFAISKQEINFYDFASYFKNIGCIQALYLDGWVSKIYLPQKKVKQLDGNFGVIIGVLKKN